MEQLPVAVLGSVSIAVAVILALVGLALFHHFTKAEDLRASHDVTGFVYAVVGVIYAVILAFVVVVVWEQFNDAETYSETEAGHIGDLRRLAQAFPDSVQARLEGLTMDYVRSVVDREWITMQHGKEDSATYRKMVAMWQAYRSFRPRPEDEPYYQESLRQMSAFNDARRERILSSRAKVPKIMWVLLIGGGVIVVGFTFLFWPPKTWPQYVTVALLTATITMTLVLILSLDHAFAGDVKVHPDAFQYLIDQANVR
ncbi:MAG: DUF4239 domain-containing protein [Bacteroidota bacterium]|nr:DUF4239 domain-containing protein [Bacteroidota bacterium]MDP4232001.1 DUF4239 domain-containing protein [Bacteroidota bacterium]MDP4241292.1 DUF4239 domain-containing protein [Bacteroidota bacterium]MDP4286684.1 DUF4239 domain-containing protein [Bacteroidota bacterium]